MYSLRGKEHPVHAKFYRSIRKKPTEAEREEGRRELKEILGRFDYRGEPLPTKLTLSAESPVKDYFAQFPGLDARSEIQPCRILGAADACQRCRQHRSGRLRLLR